MYPTATLDDRARIDDAEVRAVLQHYDIGAIERTQDFPRGAHDAAKSLIKTDRGRYVLKRRPPGRDDERVIAFAHELQHYLADRAYPIPHLIGTQRDNHGMLRFRGSLYELYEFIPGEGFNRTPAAAGEVGKMLALFHRLVHDMEYNYTPPAGHYHDSDRVRALLSKIAVDLHDSAGAPSAAGRAAEVATLVRDVTAVYGESAARVAAAGFDAWEMQIVHNDWHPGNILFQDEMVVAVLDFDSARIKPPVTDAANAALQFSMRTGDRDPHTWPDDVDEDRFVALLDGYDAVRRLSIAELRVLAPLMTEALIAEAVSPIAATGRFARLDGFAFLQTVLRKCRWLRENEERLMARWAG
ncbi:MAG: phosphotransferase [Phycisphaerae bacterium]|nr:phosphotransferase [Phycisphaerae bacterium]